MQFLKNISRILKKIEIALLVLVFGVIIILAFAQVVARNFLGSGFPWSDIVVRQLVVWSGFLGAAVAAAEDRHLSLGVLEMIVPLRMRGGLAALTKGFAMLVCLYFARASWVFVIMEKSSEEVLLPFIPVWVAAIIIPIGYVLLAVHFLVRGVEDTMGASRPRETDGAV